MADSRRGPGSAWSRGPWPSPWPAPSDTPTTSPKPTGCSTTASGHQARAGRQRCCSLASSAGLVSPSERAVAAVGRRRLRGVRPAAALGGIPPCLLGCGPRRPVRGGSGVRLLAVHRDDRPFHGLPGPRLSGRRLRRGVAGSERTVAGRGRGRRLRCPGARELRAGGAAAGPPRRQRGAGGLHAGQRRTAAWPLLALPLLPPRRCGRRRRSCRQDIVLGASPSPHLSAFPFVGGDMNLFVPDWLTTGTLAAWREQRHAFWRHLSDPNLLRLMVPSAALLVLAAAAVSPPGTRGRRGLCRGCCGARAPAAARRRLGHGTHLDVHDRCRLRRRLAVQPRQPVGGSRPPRLLAVAVLVIAANSSARCPHVHASARFFEPLATALPAVPRRRRPRPGRRLAERGDHADRTFSARMTLGRLDAASSPALAIRFQPRPRGEPSVKPDGAVTREWIRET